MKKKIVAFVMATLLTIGLTACGGSQKESMNEKSKYASAEEVLTKVYKSYREDQKFQIFGGDMEHFVEDKPAAFQIGDTEMMDFQLGFPAGQIENIDAAATMIHMLNANTFTGAAYHLKAGVDADDFAKAVKENIWNPNRQWLCGAPDTLLIIAVDKEYVITVFGQKEVTDVFKENALATLQGSKVLLEESAN